MNNLDIPNNVLQTRESLKTKEKTSSPLYLYDSQALRTQCQTLFSLQNITSRYAMKANPHPTILEIIIEEGLHIDACSENEALSCLNQGIPGNKIQIVSQQCPQHRDTLAHNNVKFVACSLHQLEQFCLHSPDNNLGIRLNPGVGSGAFTQVNVGGSQSSFGIRHTYLDDAISIATKYGKTITTLHTHIGSGTDLNIWAGVIDLSLSFVDRLPDVITLDLGGGFKVGRMPGEKSTDMLAVGDIINKKISDYAERTERNLHVEIEPGTYVVANAGYLIAQVDDIVDTGPDGYTFLKLNTGMSDILRPMMYGAQHPITILNNNTEQQEYIIVGHSCESADVFTVAPGQSDVLLPRSMNTATLGDTVIIGGAGAYCASMCASGYNGFERAREVVV